METHNDNSTLIKDNTLTEKVDLFNGVKSLYIIKYILSFLSEKQKLEMIIYNKEFQNKLGIDVEYYKKISGKYLIRENNGNGKVYELDTNKLIFEGEYKDGKKNGKGKEFYENGHLKFEGEYLNGKKIEGKGYDYDGNLVLKLKKNGKGKEYYKYKNKKFEGEYINGKRWNGKGYNYEGKELFEIKNGCGNVK